MHGLCAAYPYFVRILPKYLLDRCGLGLIIKLGRGTMGAYVVNLMRQEVGLAHRLTHCPGRLCAIGAGSGHVVGVGRGRVTDYLGVNRSPSCLGVLILFESKDSRSFGHNKSIAHRV